jgi:hypothetical protein
MHVREFMVSSVKEFAKIYKWATFKFYKITRFMRSQEDKLEQLVTDAVLSSQVSNVLFRAAERMVADQLRSYKHALDCLVDLNISFWISGKSDA